MNTQLVKEAPAKVRRPSSRVTVKRPDPKTGELMERVVPAKRFRPEAPVWPKNNDPERVAEFWEFHADQLTKDERRSVARGAHSVMRPLKPGWGRGDRLNVASRISASVEEVKKTRKGFRTTLCVRNDRPILMRRVPAAFDPPETDEFGDPTPPTPEAIKEARFDGNYTTSAAMAVDGGGDVLDDELYNRIHAETDAANAIQGIERMVTAERCELEEELSSARKRGRRGRVRVLEKKLAQHDRKLRK